MKIHLAVASVLVLACQSLSHAADPAPAPLRVVPDRADVTYDVGQTVRWSIEAAEGMESVEYVVKAGGFRDVDKGTLKLEAGKAQLESKIEQPGAMLLKLTTTGADGKKLNALAGVASEIEKVKPSKGRPDDFDAFWAGKIEELQQVPLDVQLTPVDVGTPGVSYAKITMNNIRGSKIHGQIARPATGDKFPALLIVQYAGVYPLNKGWVVDRAKEGWLVLNIIAHDLPIDEPAEFYKEQSAGPLKDYLAIGNDDRETSYFLRMYLSCYRAAEYLTNLPVWDGRTLVVTGNSQGGQQALMTAGLFPKVTAVLANVPAGCDLTGPEAGRAIGFPYWYYKTENKDVAKVRDAGRYYDVMNFASRIKCPVLVGVGMVDETCPPEGIFATMNQIDAPKEIVLLPGANHGGSGNTHAPYYKRFGHWMGELRQGRPAPVQN